MTPYTPDTGENARENRSLRRGLLLFAALLCLGLSASDIPYAARKPLRTAPTDSGLMVRHPEVKTVRDSARKRFTPAVPRTAMIPFRRPAAALFTGRNISAEGGFTPSAPGRTLAADFPEAPAFPAAASEEAAIPPISRRPDNRISLKEEMVALEDLDIGRLGGMVGPDADGARDMRKGFLRIPTVWGTQLQVPDYLKRSVFSLVEGMNRYSEVRTEAPPHLYLSSERIFRMPFLFITADTAFELTPTERRNFAEYLKSGGFALLDNATPEYDNNPAGACLRKMVRDALGSRARFEPLPVNHPLYHCWFDFNDGPPQGAETYNMQTTDRVNLCGYQARAMTMQRPVFYLEGIFIDGRMVGVYSNKGYGRKWVKLTDNIPQLKMGVNLVVYALTREGGMNAREMARYSDIQGKKR